MKCLLTSLTKLSNMWTFNTF